jgi:hypothetical protein
LIFVEENQRTWGKTLEARERVNNKLNSHVMPRPGIEPEIAVVRGERLATTPPMLPAVSTALISLIFTCVQCNYTKTVIPFSLSKYSPIFPLTSVNIC